METSYLRMRTVHVIYIPHIEMITVLDIIHRLS
jgi:hypothetical protein